MDDKAGTGKTTILCDAIQAFEKIIPPTATSAFAAQLYTGGRTTHSMLKVLYAQLWPAKMSLIAF